MILKDLLKRAISVALVVLIGFGFAAPAQANPNFGPSFKIVNTPTGRAVETLPIGQNNNRPINNAQNGSGSQSFFIVGNSTGPDRFNIKSIEHGYCLSHDGQQDGDLRWDDCAFDSNNQAWKTGAIAFTDSYTNSAIWAADQQGPLLSFMTRTDAGNSPEVVLELSRYLGNSASQRDAAARRQTWELFQQ